MTKIFNILEPLIKVLCTVDENKSPIIPWLYEAMRHMKEVVTIVSPRSKEQYIKIIERR